ncbi:lipopolysaccharide assembly protein LapA domain-containing protein [Kibdelosporangium lantanae]|uniref:Lipopolysaccharide assembly protein LapA domain-containing protein n=1 Tax=Kibdelosporangium lantanae TaxID=1497396 RepID=A0ABW3M534_9PSEU
MPTSDSSAPEPVPAPPVPATGSDAAGVTRATRISGTWIAVIVATILLVFLLIFILQNLPTVTVTFLGLSGELPLGVALLFASIVGALLVILVGAARILQLRRRVRRSSHSHSA